MWLCYSSEGPVYKLRKRGVDMKTDAENDVPAPMVTRTSKRLRGHTVA